MRATIRFFDIKGCSLASPMNLEDTDEVRLWATALAFRRAVQEKRGVRVVIHLEEQP